MRLLSFLLYRFRAPAIKVLHMSEAEKTVSSAIINNAVRYSARSLAVGLSFFLAACSTPSVKPTVEAPVVPEEPTQAEAPQVVTSPPVNISVAAVGDIMLGTDYPHDRLPPRDLELLAPVSPVLRQADVAFGNLEGVLQDGGKPFKQCGNPSRCYVFRTPVRFVEQLRRAGFDAMTLANNHARDFGEKGRSSSMAALAGAGIHHTGKHGDIASWEVKGLKVALIGFAPFGGSFDMNDSDLVRRQIEMLEQSHDIVLVTFHGGAEGKGVTRIPFEEEYFYGENRGDVVAFAHLAVESGADMVIGHGPHVPRAIELFQERLIAYSLGNFATYWGINVRGNNGLAPIIIAELDEEGRFLSGRIDSNRQIRPEGPLPDDKHRAARLIRELTLADFPQTPLMIDERGGISIRAPATLSGAPPKADVQHGSGG
jgi:hypothetical protein